MFKNRKILISANSSWNLYNFLSGLIRSLIASGFEVVVAAPFDSYSAYLGDLGCRFISFNLDHI
jgi:hypothetical protein